MTILDSVGPKSGWNHSERRIRAMVTRIASRFKGERRGSRWSRSRVKPRVAGARCNWLMGSRLARLMNHERTREQRWSRLACYEREDGGQGFAHIAAVAREKKVAIHRGEAYKARV